MLEDAISQHLRGVLSDEKFDWLEKSSPAGEIELTGVPSTDPPQSVYVPIMNDGDI